MGSFYKHLSYQSLGYVKALKSIKFVHILTKEWHFGFHLAFLTVILMCLQTPILWSHGLADRTVLFEAGQAGPPFLEKIGVSCEFKVKYSEVTFQKSINLRNHYDYLF